MRRGTNAMKRRVQFDRAAADDAAAVRLPARIAAADRRDG